MNISNLIARGMKLANDNSPLILTAIGVAGTVATAYLTARAAFRVGQDVNEGHYEKLMDSQPPEVYDTKALVKTYWKEFIPAVGTGVCTIVCIVVANRIGTRRAAALASVIAISEKALEEYKAKVVEKLGENKERKIRDEIAQDQVTNDPPSREIIITGSDVLCRDSYSGRYFPADMESLRRIENNINTQVISDGYVALQELYWQIGLPKIDASDTVGWDIDHQLNFIFSATIHEGKPIMVVTYKTTNLRKHSFH